ncbi:Transcriptional regulator, LuxR family [Oceaniovalibus guishaninsula JLT2003]|uniref:Transcriptional regulator, LuxR family n=1 Tax=Oceaniovalibus guishaninsula JLT2003 TaxID=1231392 RepID=K2HLC4_9RHOB|nr:LuxR C-terminal-related transcriptional regulator [Oceaniovalibus guishaninsula]EKE43659.1 Transcriptional regulator, LuxR family [Oceaniovalibus guishaninsula JLT2003]
MTGMDAIAAVQNAAWDIVEGAEDAGAALETMCQAIGRVRSVATYNDPENGQMVFSGHTRTDPDLLALVQQRFATAETSPQAEMLPRMEPGKFDHFGRYIDRAYLQTTEYYNDFWLPSGVGEAGAISCPSTDGRFAFATLGCYTGRDWLDPEEERAVQAMLSCVTRAMRVRVRFAKAAALARLDGAEPDPAFLIDLSGRLLLSNAAATAALSRGVLTARGQMLKPRDPVTAAEYADQLTRMVAAREPAPVILRDGPRYANLTFEAGPSYRDDRTIVVGLRAARPLDWTARAAQRHLGLTAREADIVLRLAQGATTAAIAADTGLTLGSVQLNLKRSFAKTDTHAQAELVQLILTGHAPC